MSTARPAPYRCSKCGEMVEYIEVPDTSYHQPGKLVCRPNHYIKGTCKCDVPEGMMERIKQGLRALEAKK